MRTDENDITKTPHMEEITVLHCKEIGANNAWSSYHATKDNNQCMASSMFSDGLLIEKAYFSNSLLSTTEKKNRRFRFLSS